MLGTQRKVVALPDSFEPVPPAATGEANTEAADLTTAERPANAASASRKRPKVVHRRERAPEQRIMRPERPQVEARGWFGNGTPMTHDQWRYDHGQQRDWRSWGW
jgi:hypothetical protein